MKRAILGTLLGAGLAALGVGVFDRPAELLAQHTAAYSPTGPGGELIALPSLGADKSQMLTVIDPRQQAMGVYHIDLTNGKITLMSVRNIRWDLQMTEFNGVNPLPREIRALLEQR